MVLKTFYTILKNSFNWIILKMSCGVTIIKYNHILICKNVFQYLFQFFFYKFSNCSFLNRILGSRTKWQFSTIKMVQLCDNLRDLLILTWCFQFKFFSAWWLNHMTLILLINIFQMFILAKLHVWIAFLIGSVFEEINR